MPLTQRTPQRCAPRGTTTCRQVGRRLVQHSAGREPECKRTSVMCAWSGVHAGLATVSPSGHAHTTELRCPSPLQAPPQGMLTPSRFKDPPPTHALAHHTWQELAPAHTHMCAGDGPGQGTGKAVVIVGAGPAGILAASHFARHGYSVQVLEVGGWCNRHLCICWEEGRGAHMWGGHTYACNVLCGPCT